MRIALLAFTFALAAPILGQTKVTVNVPPGDVVAFATKGPATAPPVDPIVPKQQVVDLTVSTEDRINVWDRTGNRTAHTAVSPTWSPKLGDLVDLALVTFDLQHDGKPVAAANVTLDDGQSKRDMLVDPGSKGAATFFDVKPGSVKLTVKYRAAGKDAAPVTQIFDVKAEGETIPHFVVALPEAAEVLGPPPTVATTPGAPGAATATGPAPATGTAVGPAAPAAPSGGFNFVGTLFALVIGGAAAAGIWYFIKNNPDTVGASLEKLGAQIPKSGDAALADPPVAAAPAAAPPLPPQKIVLDSAPDPIQVAAPPIQMSSAPTYGAVLEPSLISESGIPIPLTEGETVVGREIGLGLSLAGETTVSRRHATIVRSGNSVVVQDGGSTNGTFVNGVAANGAITLNPGDAVQFGSVRFRYEG